MECVVGQISALRLQGGGNRCDEHENAFEDETQDVSASGAIPFDGHLFPYEVDVFVPQFADSRHGG